MICENALFSYDENAHLNDGEYDVYCFYHDDDASFLYDHDHACDCTFQNANAQLLNDEFYALCQFKFLKNQLHGHVHNYDVCSKVNEVLNTSPY